MRRAACTGLRLALAAVGGCAAQPAGPSIASSTPEPCRIELTVPAEPSAPLHVAWTLPADAPDPLILRAAAEPVGFYAICDFAPFFRDVAARDAAGASLAVSRAADGAWTVAGRARTVSWDVDAVACERDLADMNTSTHRRPGYTLLSGYATFLLASGLEQRPCDVTLVLPEGWRVAWSLPRSASGTWRAANALELLDEPAMLGTAFLSRELPHPTLPSFVHVFSEGEDGPAPALAVLAAEQEDAVRSLAALELPPTSRPFHVFFELWKPIAGKELGWGLEHGNSFQGVEAVEPAIRAGPRLAYHIEHHMLHAWIPRRLYTDALHPERQLRGEPTGAIWFAEGFAQYLACVGLARGGAVATPVALELLARRFAIPYSTQIPKTARSMVERSAWMCSRDQDDWFYGYSEGALLAMWLDEKLREARPERDGLPEAMRTLFAKWHDGPGIPEDRFEAAFSEAAGVDVSAIFARCVRGDERLPCDEILAAAGIVREGDAFRVLPDADLTPEQARFRARAFR